jgi:hypothetical protein
MRNDFPAQKLPVYMRVNFRSRDALVPEHHLYGAQIGAPLEQMRGKGMAHGMRAYILADPRNLRLLLYDMKDHHTSQSRTTPVQEKRIFGTFPYIYIMAVKKIIPYFENRLFGNRN